MDGSDAVMDTTTWRSPDDQDGKPFRAGGADGWDLGDWPYVAIYIRKADGRWQVQQIVEGDHTIYAFDSQEDAYAAIDYLFIWYGVGREYDQWKAEGLTCESRATLNAGTLRVPEQFRGPYRQRQS